MLSVLRRMFSRDSSPSGNPKDAKDLKEWFSRIYSDNIFGGKESRSGEGSSLEQTAEIRRELPQLIKEFDIESFMDAPCGDFFWMREVALGVNHYIGVDIVRELVEEDQDRYGEQGRSFQCLNLAEDSLPRADLVFCRDCLVHLNYEDIRKVLDNFKRSKSTYLLTTTFTGRTSNDDLIGKDSIWRPLNLELPPFNFPKPIKLINEQCTEGNHQFTDKSLGLWLLDEIRTG